jgi:hypothetical protein
MFSCMPRSASATITHVLARVLDVPVLRFSVGRFPDYYVVPSWLDMFLEGGAVNQDHLGPSEFNLGVLSGRDFRHLFVLARDPRAAARSQVHFNARVGGLPGPLEASIEEECVSRFIPWLQRWIDCSANGSLPFQVHWLSYREVCSDPAAVVRKIVGTLQWDYPALRPYVDLVKVPELKLHFVTGDDDAWRAEVGDATKQRLWSACSSDVRNLLKLEE